MREREEREEREGVKEQRECRKGKRRGREEETRGIKGYIWREREGEKEREGKLDVTL
jgi:hypothetical protein